MADVTISGLPNEAASATVDGDADWLEIDDVGAVETKRVHPRALLVGLTGASVGAVGKDILTQGGVGGPGDGGTPGGTGGAGIVDAGPGGSDGGAGAGTAGAVSIGETNAASIASGSGSTTWTHDGLLRAAIGAIGTPGHSFGTATGVGLRVPAANQLGLVANGEEVVVDNDGATPSFRPDVDDVWTLGEDALGWGAVFADSLVIPGSTGRTVVTGTLGVGTLAMLNEYSGLPELTYLQRFGLTSDGQVAHDFKCEIAQSAAEGYTGLKLVVTETTLGSGTKNLVQVLAGAAGVTERMRLNNAGALVLPAPGAVGAPTVIVGGGIEGLFEPAANQLGLAANSEAVIVDNAGATPALRPDVDNTWDLGSVGKAWLTVTAYIFNAQTRVLTPTGSVGAPSVAIGSVNEGLYSPASNQLGLAANNEGVIVDNDSATPSFRPDADDVWSLGEASFRWSIVRSVAAVISTTLDVPAGTGFKIGGAALTTAEFTAPNVDLLLDGSDVGALHTHAGLSVPDQATATGDTTTTSGTDVLLPAMTVTPGAGNYLVHFTFSGNVSGTNTMTVSLYVNGVQVAHTEREHQGSNEGAPGFSAYITGVGGGEAVEVRWRTTSGTATSHERTLIVLPWT